MKTDRTTTVLLVEDSALEARLVERLLDHAGPGQFCVTHVATLAKALLFLCQPDIDVVLLDLNLSDSTGLETLRSLLARSPQPPIVVLTGADEDAGIQAMREGAQDYIPKAQLQAPLLARSLRYAMERHRSSLALRESNESLSRVITSASDAIITKNRLGIITSWNPAAERLFGYSAEEALGKSLLMLFPPDRMDEEPQIMARIARGERVEHFESVRIRKDGRPVQVALTISPIWDNEGQITGASKIARDITAQKKAEESSRFHENLLRETGHIAKVGGWEFDVATGNGYWTEEVARIHELDPQTQPSKEMGLKFYSEESAPKIERALLNTIEHGIPYDLELELNTAKGNHRWVRTIGHPVFENQKVVKLRGSFQDITERKLAEEKLRQQASLLDQAFDAVLVWERDGAITFWNQGAEHMYGFSKQEAIGRVTQQLLHTSASDGMDSVLQTLASKGNWEGELVHTRRDGKRIVVESRMVQITEDGRCYVLETNRDVSEARLLEAQLRQSQKMEAVGRLAGGVAHDFNNLLGVILGSAELLADASELSLVQRRAAEILKAGQRAANLTRQLLAFSRKQILEPRVIDLNAKISEITEMLVRLVGEDVEINALLPPDGGNVRADPSQIEQILLNLVVNARDAMPGGGKITIETHNVDLDESYAGSHSSVLPGRYVMIAVSDSGHGMNAETLAHIFEPFFTTKPSGTGLGLAMVYGAVKQSGGHIWVYSEPAKGTTFKIYFPRVDSSVETASVADRPAAPPTGTETILLVEDSDSLRELTKEFLQIAGYKVMDARDGQHALQLARSHEQSLHLLLTDVVMPGISGRELADEIKRMHPAIRVLFMSGYTANAIVHRGVLDEGLSLLTKPFTRSGLTQKVHQMLKS